MTASLKQCNGSTAFTICALHLKESLVQLHEGNLLGAESKRNMRFFRISLRKQNWTGREGGAENEHRERGENEKKEFIELRIGNEVFDHTFHFPF